MINTGTLTGDYDASGYVGVKLSHGEEIFARPIMTGPMVANYTKDWVDAYGKNFIAVIGYENDLKERPLLMGIMPLKNPKFPVEGYENNYFVTTKNFRLWFNDDDNELVVDVLKEGGTVKLGNKDVTEPAVLGHVAVNLLNEFIDDLGKVATITTSSGVTYSINTSPNWPTLVSKWQQKFGDMLSETVYLKE